MPKVYREGPPFTSQVAIMNARDSAATVAGAVWSGTGTRPDSSMQVVQEAADVERQERMIRAMDRLSKALEDEQQRWRDAMEPTEDDPDAT